MRLELDDAQFTSTEATLGEGVAAGTASAPRAPEPPPTPDGDSQREAKPAATERPAVVIAPGTTVTARLVIERNGFDGDLKFDVDNLPHGVIVDNIGLSGIFIPAGKSERQLFLAARDWVEEQTREFHAVGLAEGNQASLPLRLVVRRARP